MASKLIKGAGEDPSGSRIGLPPRAPPADPAQQAAAQMVAEAERQARAILDNAEEEAQAAIAAARERGDEEGKASAAEVQQLAERLELSLSENLEQEALECAVDACKELISLELKNRPRTIVDIATKALGAAKHQREIYVRAHPHDAALLRESKRQLLDSLSRARDLDIREDIALTIGGCMIETEIGLIDARIETQLSTLTKRLLGRVV